MYSRNVSKKVLKLQEDQRKEIAKATELKMKASTHEEKLKIQAKSRSTLNKMVAKHHEVKAPKEAQAPKEEKMIDLKNKKEVAKAIKSAMKAK